MNTSLRFIIFSSFPICIIALAVLSLNSCHDKKSAEEQVDIGSYAGSRSCQECHERFYNLWSPSHHGKAMQAVEDVLSKDGLVLPVSSIKVGGHWFDVTIDSISLYMIEKENQTTTKKINRYEAKWALGGRNIFYFLTPFEGGRLQTMPLAYDINREEWYSTPGSAVRHFVDNMSPDEEIDWKHSLYTFNTTCHSCHVSQLEKNYDLTTDTYHTTWKEPGINCETCHGPSEAHIRVCREAEKNGTTPVDLKIISVKAFTAQQRNAACASCHAKGMPLTLTYVPGEPFFQHFNLLTLENPDYYPDGRDLGENYTLTSWLQSACVANSDLNCVTCHTSSGRYRFKNNDNESCAACHEEQIENFEVHTHHTIEDSLTCISCHMPKTEFARMTRSDHSMRPPTPVTTMEFGSPNACNICHREEDAEWSNKHVTEWHGNYQDETVGIARLIYEGRNGKFQHLEEMLEMINDHNIDVIFRNSMIRILRGQVNESNAVYFFEALKDKFPLIRASATEAIGSMMNEKTKNALLEALKDSVMVVRNRASSMLASYPRDMFTQEEWKIVENNFKSYEDFLMTYPDTWSAHFNMGSYYQGRGMHTRAVQSYEKAAELEGEAIMPLVNASLAYSILGNNLAAEQKLKKALELDPQNAAANLNYGLLLAQIQRFDEARKHLIQALESDSTMGAAAYNLAVISAQNDLMAALRYSNHAYMVEPDNPKYGYTYAFYTFQSGNRNLAASTLRKVIKSNPYYLDAYLFLASIYEESGNMTAAINVYEQAIKLENLPEDYQQNIRMRLNMLKQ